MISSAEIHQSEIGADINLATSHFRFSSSTIGDKADCFAFLALLKWKQFRNHIIATFELQNSFPFILE